MKKYNVKVNGVSYEVEIEDAGVTTQAAAAVRPSTTEAVVSAPATKVDTSNGVIVKAPLPGIVLELLVPNNSKVVKGAKLVVIEAMKMKNDIVASADGIVTFAVAPNANVSTGDTLCVIK